ncbi:MAG: FeoB-associated Cys-rich membrane protein [Chryseolinea sp.]
MIQQILVVLLFAAALAYLGRLLYKSLYAKSGCATGCGKCGAVDFDKIEAQIKSKGL